MQPPKARYCLFMHRSTKLGLSDLQQAVNTPAHHEGLSEQQWSSIEVVLRCGLKALNHKGTTAELQAGAYFLGISSGVCAEEAC